MGSEHIILGDLILVELLQGFRLESDFEKARAALLKFPLYDMVGVEIAVQSAIHYRYLRSRGFTVRKTIDCLIATFCIQHNHTLLHADRDFDPFEQHLQLQVRHP